MRFQHLLLCVSALCIVPASVSAGTVLSEDFNELTPALGVTSVGAFSAIGGTNVDIVGGALYGSLCAAPESGSCVDLDGSGGNPQGILQTSTAITLNPGTNYYLSFDLIGSGRSTPTSTTVSFGTYNRTFDLSSSDVSSGVVSNALVTVGVTTNTNLTFTSNTPGEIGAVLDNVLITSEATSAAPEPSSVVLVGSALMGCGLLARRRVWGRQ